MELDLVEELGEFPALAYRDTFAPHVPEPIAGAALPPGWEGLYFPFRVPLADLREDGSPARDGILPEFGLPIRRYAGEDTTFHRPLRYGDPVRQRTRAGTVTEKTGRSGRLVFADLVRTFHCAGELAVESVWHDVFLEANPGSPRQPEPAPDRPADWTETLIMDRRMLFRFSAITFNTHRIHYDLDWARTAENLPDLLVHGPLLRLLLLDSVVRQHPDRAVHGYRFRALAPTLAETMITISGRSDDDGAGVFALDQDHGILAEGRIDWADPVLEPTEGR
ncbi:hypothetical protein [Microlunatus sp. GCM10028923]|uniref:hypothetical protein n=1 Tax=Microlunatus sp. GCM10028923 TaxID=3273400 RepID=UPI00360B295F